MEIKTRYTMVDKSGKEIYHSDSFFGFIGTAFLVNTMSVVVISIIGAVICGISSLFG